MPRLKFKRSLKFVKYVQEGRVMGIPCENYMVVSVQDGMGDLKFSRCVQWGQRIKVPKEITAKLTDEEKDLLDGIRKHIQKKKAAEPVKTSGHRP